MPTLHWLTREEDIKAAAAAEYRLLREEPGLGGGDGDALNMLVQGDNLEALRALLPFYAGQVKCAYIDPPYNTGSAFEHYDDGLEHAAWLSMMRPRLELLRELLAGDGSLWVSIDDDEGHYLKVLCDEIFGRENFVNTVVWEKKYSSQANARWLSDSHDFLLVYAKNKKLLQLNVLPRTTEMDNRYKNPDNDPRGVWKAVDATIGLSGGQRGAQYAKTGVSANIYELITPSGRKLMPAKGRCWYYTPDKMQAAIAEKRIWFGENGDRVPALKRFLTEVKQGVTAKTIWFRAEVGDNQEAKRETMLLDSDSIFATPKPERLIARVLEIATGPGDLVLDSFLGSGTTAAVAHKMGRRWIGVEMGGHARTHCAARLRKVIAGEQGGVSGAAGWAGGGGFRFYTLGDPVFDGEGRIRKDIKFGQLAAHVWFLETRTPLNGPGAGPFLGVHGGTAYALLYNGVLGDRSVGGGNVLTERTLAAIEGGAAAAGAAPYGRLVVYGESSRVGAARAKALGLEFRQTPYDVRAK
jgi:adenine-specific DNA-methyltransferase